MDIPVYIITLSATDPISKNNKPYKELAKEEIIDCLHQCYVHNVRPNLFPAIDGYSIPDDIWQQHNLVKPVATQHSNPKFGDLPGAQGCFLSHFLLWKLCYNTDTTIIILEDDAIVKSPLIEQPTADVVKLHLPRMSKIHKSQGHWSPGAFAYQITPVGAKKLIEFCKDHGPGHADKLIASNIVDWKYAETPTVELSRRSASSTNPVRYPLLGK